MAKTIKCSRRDEIYWLRTCDAPLQHVFCYFRHEALQKMKIPFIRVDQKPGELLMTGSFVMHQGYNEGLLPMEACTFTTRDAGELQKTEERQVRDSELLLRSILNQFFLLQCTCPQKYSTRPRDNDIDVSQEAMGQRRYLMGVKKRRQREMPSDPELLMPGRTRSSIPHTITRPASDDDDQPGTSA